MTVTTAARRITLALNKIDRARIAAYFDTDGKCIHKAEIVPGVAAEGEHRTAKEAAAHSFVTYVHLDDPERRLHRWKQKEIQYYLDQVSSGHYLTYEQHLRVHDQ